MAVHNLYIDKDRGEPVIGKSDSSIAKLPPFVQGDSIGLRVFILQNYSRANPYDYVPVSGITIQAVLGVKKGTADEGYYTQQFTWVASVDLEQPYFEALFPMNTVEIDNLLGDASEAEAWFEVKMVDSGLPTTILSKRVIVHASVIKEGELEVPAGQTPLSAETGNVTYLGRVIYDYFDIRNRATGKGRRIYVDENGDFKTDALTDPP